MTDHRRGKGARAPSRSAKGSRAPTPRTIPTATLGEVHPDARREAQLDAGLEDTFPASDPVAIDPRSD
jgi:hypothetical protein